MLNSPLLNIKTTNKNDQELLRFLENAKLSNTSAAMKPIQGEVQFCSNCLKKEELYSIKFDYIIKSYFLGLISNDEKTFCKAESMYKNKRYYRDVPFIFQVVWGCYPMKYFSKFFRNQSWCNIKTKVCLDCFLNFTQSILQKRITNCKKNQENAKKIFIRNKEESRMRGLNEIISKFMDSKNRVKPKINSNNRFYSVVKNRIKAIPNDQANSLSMEEHSTTIQSTEIKFNNLNRSKIKKNFEFEKIYNQNQVPTIAHLEQKKTKFLNRDSKNSFIHRKLRRARPIPIDFYCKKKGKSFDLKYIKNKRSRSLPPLRYKNIKSELTEIKIRYRKEF